MEMEAHFSPDLVHLIRSTTAFSWTPCQGNW